MTFDRHVNEFLIATFCNWSFSSLETETNEKKTTKSEMEVLYDEEQ